MAAKKVKLDWRKAALEVGGIVFAVLLALWLEGWREEVEQQERAEEYAARIRSEISQNRDGLLTAIETHRTYIEGLDAALKSGDVNIKTVAPYLKIEGGTTSDAAWRSAQMSQSISKMPIETVAALASLYDTQSYYTGYLNFFFQLYTDLTLAIQEDDSGRIAVQKFRQHLSITNSLAEQLMVQYDSFLQSADGVVSPAAASETPP